MTTCATIITVTLNPAVDKALRVPGFRVGNHARAEPISLQPGGKGVNVARGVSRLGGRAGAFVLVGARERHIFAERLAEEGVEARFRTVQGMTRFNTTIVDPEEHTTTHLREPGFDVAAEDLSALRDALIAWLADAPAPAAVVFAGSIPPGMDADDFAGMLGACAEAGARVIVDTNGPALRAAVESGAADAVKPNLEELSECLGRPVSRQDAAAEAAALLDRVDTVLLTLGREGAYLVDRDGVIGRCCPVDDSRVRNTVGCGDAFLAGWLYGRQRGDGPAESLSWAVAAGAASAMGETTVGYSRDDVTRLIPRCRAIADP